MQTIHQLSQHIISKIAAGEVIERPAYAIKELLENAIDAQATYITIQIEHGGLKKISVGDNGIGMSREDCIECIKPHATSKIKHEEDLLAISSLGFRGEALASIAAISNIVIKSRLHTEQTGTRIEAHAGHVTEIVNTGMPPGTHISIDDLFYTVPTRKKFLKSIATELRYIIDIVAAYALSYPNIRFFLSHNKKVVLDCPEKQDILERIRLILGDSVTTQLVPVNYQDSYITISGFIAKPQITSQTTNKQFIFVNKRRITNSLISLAVKESYGNLLEKTSYPIFVISLILPYETVDINIHPRKDNVSFSNNKMIFDTISLSIKQTLETHNLTFQNISWRQETKNNTHSYAGTVLKKIIFPSKETQKILFLSDILQLNNLYMGIKTTNGFIFVDQHAAHERILFNQFHNEFLLQKNKKQLYTLPTALSFNISQSDSIILKEYMAKFIELGFTISEVKNATFSISTIPTLFKDRNVIEIITEMIEDLSMNKEKKIDTKSYTMLTYLACHAAIKAGDVLSKPQARQLIKNLEHTEKNATCPHGRPTKIEVTTEALDKLFKRE